MKLYSHKRAVALLSCLPLVGAIMATQGDDTLTGTDDDLLSAEQAEQGLLLVRGLDDLRFQWTASEKRQQDLADSLCVQAAARSYEVTFVPAGNGFMLTDGQRRVPFELSFNGVAPGPDYRVPLQVGSITDDCDQGENARVGIRLNARSLKSLPPGSYTSTVTMLIAPE